MLVPKGYLALHDKGNINHTEFEVLRGFEIQDVLNSIQQMLPRISLKSINVLNQGWSEVTFILNYFVGVYDMWEQ